MISYTVMTEEQAERARFRLLPVGIYKASIQNAEERRSKSGNDMIEMTLKVYNNDGEYITLKDWLVFSPKMMWKVIKFAKNNGLIKDYESGKFSAQLIIGLYLTVAVDIEGGRLIPDALLNGQPQGATYPARNIISEYLDRNYKIAGQPDKVEKIEKDAVSQNEAQPVEPFEISEGDIPF